VIPAFNCAPWIGEALDSVFAQTVAPAQVIVLDDGSTDDTAERVRPVLDRVQYVRQPNSGVSATRNRGMALAREAFVAFLDGDDVWHPRKIELQMEAFRRRPDLAILSTPVYDYPSTAPEVTPALAAELPVHDVSWESMAVKNRMNTSSVIIRRDVIERVAPFDTAMQGPEDRDFWLRVLEVAPGAILAIPLSGYRITPGGISQNAARCRDGMLRILQKVDARGGWTGRWLLRRKAYSYVNHACSCLFSDSGSHGEALACCLRSIAWFPLPYGRDEVVTPCERLKRTAVVGVRLVRAKCSRTARTTGETSRAPKAATA
jgi:glycosyltransferase involved in cell wall biosynthesis